MNFFLNIETYIYGLDNAHLISDHTKDTAPVSHQLTEVKLLQALAVLWWGTTWEGRVSDKLLLFFLITSLHFLLVVDHFLAEIIGI